MIFRLSLAVLALGALTGCQPAIPDSGAGVAFDNANLNSALEQRRREAALSGTALPAAAPVAQTVLAPNDGSAAATAAETARVLDATRPGGLGNDAATNSGVEPLNASPSNPPPVLSSTGISNENSFDAVASERSIAGDAARIAANRAQYEVIQPEALPDRSGAGQPNIVAYALQTSHPRGQKVYSRRGFNLAAKSARNCAAYASPDQAQIDFLEGGGPERDRQALDPDGDGYACNWDPTSFRKAAQG